MSELYDPITQWFKSHCSPPQVVITDVVLRLIGWLLLLESKPLHFFAGSQYPASAICTEFLKEEQKNHIYHEVVRNTVESWGIVINSFTELHTKSFDSLKGFTKNDQVWGAGPLAIVKADSERGGPTSMPSEEVMAWLDSCHLDRSVVYVGFGTEITLNKQQMEALVDALGKSGVRFIWAVKKPAENGVDHDNSGNRVVPSGFEDSAAGRGIVIRGWAPQAKIQQHRAVRSYLTHLGWGSLFEGLMGGVLLLACPMQSDHFHNKKLLLDELGTAIPVCEGLGTIPDSENVGQILADSLDLNRPERIAWMELIEKALNAYKGRWDFLHGFG